MPGEVVHGFTDVDRQPDPQSWVRVLDSLHREPFCAAYKRRVAELVGPRAGERYLEIGSGTGADALAISRGIGCAVTGLDGSFTMAREARRRGLTTALAGDAHRLPFPDGCFAGCWADRTFQHLAEPEAALREAVRVLCGGGRMVAVDPDYGTQTLDFPDAELSARVLQFRAERGLRNGTLARAMAGLFVAAGLRDVRVEALTLVVRDPSAVDNVMGLRTWARSVAAVGWMPEADAARWESLFDETVKADRFLYAVTFFITTGRKPAPGNTAGD